jgi:hypothetical protein
MKIKSKRLLKLLLIAFPIVLLCAPILRIVVANAGIVYPTPETQSSFIKGYSPADVLAPFSLEGSQQSGPGGSSAGRGCAFHQKEFQSWLVIASGKEPTLMAAVQQDLKSRLGREGTKIVAESGNGRERFQFDYAAGKSRGSVVVDPLMIVDPVSFNGPHGIPSGEVAVNLRIRILETWYKASERDCRKL